MNAIGRAKMYHKGTRVYNLVSCAMSGIVASRVSATDGGSRTSGARSTSLDSTVPLSLDHPLTHTTPALVPSLCRTARMAVRVLPTMSPGLFASIAYVATMSDLAFQESLESNSESENAKDEGPTTGDEGLAVRDGGFGQGFGSVPEPERSEGVSALRQPTLTTWIHSKDGIAYIDVPAYPPAAPFTQTSLSPESSPGSFPISPTPSIVPLRISSPMISLTVPLLVALPATIEAEGFLTELGAQVEMQGGLICDHTVRLGELSPALLKRYDRDIGELFTRALWRLMLALKAWAGRVDTQMTDISQTGYDDHRLVHDILL
nr:hypothetical protein [Tanacetum cinerariifolium]